MIIQRMEMAQKEIPPIIAKLKELLENATQEALAQQIGVTVSTVNRWVNRHSDPSKLAVIAIEGLHAQAKTNALS